MYLSRITIENFRCFGDGNDRFELSLGPGLTALVGENDSGKTAVIDAIRFALGTTDQDWYRIEDTDFHGEETSRQIRIVCEFNGLTAHDKRAFVEYLSYGLQASDDPVLIVNWTAKDTKEQRKGRPYRRGEVHSGREGQGPTIAPEARDLLRATYLRPLRDAEQALSAGRGSRLSQVLHRTSQVTQGGEPYVPARGVEKTDPMKLNVLGIGDFANALLARQKGVGDARGKIDEHLQGLALRGESVKSAINVSGTTASDDIRLRQLLEKLDLSLGGIGKLGLGSNNLLFMACEFLLLAQEDEGSKLLLIEEPEAHLHAQRQLRAMKFLQDQAKDIQIIVTTHSPNLASAIDLDNIVMIHNRRAYSMAKEHTELEPSDYRFLQRFLDVTKANLFFARGVVIVEGDAENILLPTLARLIGRDFTEHGVSIVNVGGVGLRRYARIFQRKNVKDEEKEKQLRIPVACVTDMDVMPDCASEITGKTLPTKGELGQKGLSDRRASLQAKASGQCVETFVSDEWTLEYDLAYCGLAEHVYVVAHLAKKDKALDEAAVKAETAAAEAAFKQLEGEARTPADGAPDKAVLAAKVYAQFTKDTKASKAVAAQYLAQRLVEKFGKNKPPNADLQNRLPNYLIQAIEYVTSPHAASAAAKENVPLNE
jgi:putative ATP-dependent endonuclease of OLD family